MRSIMRDKRGVIQPILLLIVVALIIYFGIKSQTPASIVATGTTESGTSANKCIIDKARIAGITYVAADANDANITATADNGNLNNYYINSFNNSEWVAAGIDFNGTMTLTLKQSVATGQECNAVIYAVSPSYKDQVDTGAGANDIYDLIDTTSTTSELNGLTSANRVDAITWQENVYLNSGSVATTSSNKEFTTIPFAAGSVSATLGFGIDLSATSLDKLKQYNDVQILFKQQTGSQASSSDNTIFTLTYRKGNLGVA